MDDICTKRLKKEYMKIKKEGIPNILAEPNPKNILEWHYVIFGLEDKESPYYGGFYHGKIIFPKEYPYKPPSIYMITPNGRFQTDTRLCLSMR
jgi:ubiquitin-conjugating enzyme E2 J2